jgi:hypothetical protein
LEGREGKEENEGEKGKIKTGWKMRHKNIMLKILM